MVRDENRFYQVERQRLHHAPAKSKVTVCEWPDGRVEIHYRGRKLSWSEIPAPPSPTRQEGGPRRQEAGWSQTRRSGDRVPTIPGGVHSATAIRSR